MQLIFLLAFCTQTGRVVPVILVALRVDSGVPKVLIK